MGAVSGDINSLSTDCIDEVDLASRPIAAMKSGDRAYVQSKANTVEGPLFFLDRDSVLPVDGIGVLATLGGVGRWLSEALYGGGGGGGGGGLLQVYPVPVTINGQTNFVLPVLPAFGSKVQMFVNGVFYEQGVDFTLLGVNVTWVNPIPLQTGPNADRVVFAYQV